ncbi:hypothetical protein WN51_06827 [Melipona quadrifasciata]|uniref:Uncharacterized protein n=1 Tax=Melipona quadrifasciata TaxID=166423 RepID=A0A0M8ZQK1_9HYME|nr:hypothetical protein WN51_06827 [Melipona quadrifasciata]
MCRQTCWNTLVRHFENIKMRHSVYIRGKVYGNSILWFSIVFINSINSVNTVDTVSCSVTEKCRRSNLLLIISVASRIAKFKVNSQYRREEGGYRARREEEKEEEEEEEEEQEVPHKTKYYIRLRVDIISVSLEKNLALSPPNLKKNSCCPRLQRLSNPTEYHESSKHGSKTFVRAWAVV